MADLQLRGVTKIYGDASAATPTVADVSFDVADGEFLALVGPSGCGKSTLLRMIAGLETPTSGEIRIGGRVMTDVPPGARDVAMVFQSYALYPQMTVFENLAFALRIRGLRDAALRSKVESAAATMGLTPHLARRPGELSGGERQRVALGRALVREPQLFLFDEPLSNLDAALRVQMRRELAALHQRTRGTMVYVTHDQVEAMTLANRIAVMDRGRVQQVATPAEMYARPATRFVASFVGSPAMNFVSAQLDADRSALRVESFGTQVLVPIAGDPAVSASVPIDAGIRPESVSVDPASALRGTVELVEQLGHETLLHVRLGTASVVSRIAARPITTGESVGLSFAPDAWQFFEPSTGRRLEASSC
jgi:multiple sugar transport system ATP-binding protein